MADVRDRYDAYCEAVERETYRFRSGRKSTLDLDPLDDRFGDVTGGDFLDEVDGRVASGFTEEAREGWRRLALAIRASIAARKSRPLQREVGEREAAQKLRVNGIEGTLYEWQSSLGSEPDAARRERIQEALESVTAELNPLREELWVRRAETLAGVGYDTVRAWATARHPGVDYDRWRDHADHLLERTESVYRDGMSRALSEIGVDFEHAHPGDAARVFRMAALDRIFPASRIEGALDFTTQGMEIRLRGLSGVTVDSEARPGKHPRACVIAPGIPGEIYLLYAPRGGEPDYESLFHEAGHVFHLAFTSQALPVERRRIFDPALSETWAFLMHYRLADPDWIAESPASGWAERVLSAVRLHKLFLLRRYAAKLRFELELVALAAGESPRPLAELYAEELGAATGLRYREAAYLADTDPDLYCVDYLRAWSLEVRIAEHLRERFGRRFWKEPRAGRLLKELWNTGGTYTAEELASELGLGPIDPGALIEECLANP